ncbi:hypothetical protein H072_1815 [Dactylellina haptotyla CBS 200.50]|uniref:F-box domain-containing protein n=1 Tax=Dactylellina haptotyla (strain CBS 200.50) TaxID=1284197 RepID=S8AMG3_DACHA|nr:hypothetical protein H072_1815 [Dactylellina haptotyla CBS 200.50]
MADPAQQGILSLSVEIHLQILSYAFDPDFAGQIHAAATCDLWKNILLNDNILKKARYEIFRPYTHKLLSSIQDRLLFTVENGTITRYRFAVLGYGLLDFPFIDEPLRSPFSEWGHISSEPRNPSGLNRDGDIEVSAVNAAEFRKTSRAEFESLPPQKSADTIYFHVSLNDSTLSNPYGSVWMWLAMDKDTTIRHWMETFYYSIRTRLGEIVPGGGGKLDIRIRLLPFAHPSFADIWYLDAEISDPVELE